MDFGPTVVLQGPAEAGRASHNQPLLPCLAWVPEQQGTVMETAAATAYQILTRSKGVSGI